VRIRIRRRTNFDEVLCEESCYDQERGAHVFGQVILEMLSSCLVGYIY
jgi:hypothetical protein